MKPVRMDVPLVQQAAGNEEEVIGRGSSREMTGEEKDDIKMEETIMKCGSIVKRLAVAAVAAAALAGPVTTAHALQFGQGDAVLAVYGNGTEYVRNLGSFSSLISNGLTLDLSSIVGSIGGANPVQVALFGATDAEGFFGNKFPLTSFSNSQKNQANVNQLQGNLGGWSNSLLAVSDARNLFPSTDPLSFSQSMNSSGNNSLGGSVPPARPSFAGVGENLYLLLKPSTGTGSSMTQVGIAVFGANGQFQVSGNVSAVPVPAAVVLFASGLVGLVGLARRRMSGTSQKAA